MSLWSSSRLAWSGSMSAGSPGDRRAWGGLAEEPPSRQRSEPSATVVKEHENAKDAPAVRQRASGCPWGLLGRGFRVEAEGGGVYAVALASRGRSVVKDVPLVGAADRAVDLRPAHEHAAVLLRLDVV